MKLHATFRPAPALLFAAIALAVAAVAQPTAAQRPGMGAGPFANNPGVRLWMALDQRYEQVTERLGLAEAQVESVTALVEAFREENEEPLERYNEAMTQMRNRMGGAMRGAGNRRGTGERPNRQGMRPGGGMANMAGMADLMQELSPAFETLHADILELLDEEQTEALNELLAARPPAG